MYLTLEEATRIDERITHDTLRIASQVIDQYCGRTFSVTEHSERINLKSGSRRLTHTPVIELRAVRGLLRDYSMFQHFGESWTDINIADVTIDDRGEIFVPSSIWNTPYDAVEVTYLSGWTEIPEAVALACGIIAKQLVGINTGAANLQAYKLSSFITPEVADLLSTYLAERRSPLV